MNNEKQKVAFSSVIAAVFLTVTKIVVGILTGSLGIVSEAAHSALDLGAAVITFFAVRFSDKPADRDHHYGHGKIESFSALIETLLLLVTCGWIIHEAIQRLFYGRPLELTEGEIILGILVMGVSIAVNISRSIALKRVAKKYGSQALEADALHFDSDVWGSLVVIGGLICVGIGDYFKISWLHYGDPLAALGVSVLVIFISVDLGKRTIDVLLDTAPKGLVEQVQNAVGEVAGVLDLANVRIRPSGPKFFIDLNIGIARNESHRVVHTIVHNVRAKLERLIPGSDILIGTFPVDFSRDEQEIFHTVKKVVDTFPNCTNIHKINIYEISGLKYIAIHLEIKEKLTLKESHYLSHRIGELIQAEMTDVQDVTVTFEYVKRQNILAEDISKESMGLINEISAAINKTPQRLNCHDIRLYKQNEKITVFLHCELNGNYSVERIEKVSDLITAKIKRLIANIENIHIHVEPRGDTET